MRDVQRNAPMLSVDSRVRLRCDVERFPDFIAREGATGTVSRIERGFIWVRMDEVIEGAEEWDNEIGFALHYGEVLSETLEPLTRWAR